VKASLVSAIVGIFQSHAFAFQWHQTHKAMRDKSYLEALAPSFLPRPIRSITVSHSKSIFSEKKKIQF
jgi:hypothetical protein